MQDYSGQDGTEALRHTPGPEGRFADSRFDDRIISSGEQQQAFRRAQRHTRRVKWLKWGVPLLALGIIAGFISWVAGQKPPAPPEELVVKQDEAFKQEELIMQNPKLNGFSQGRAYEVVAARAIQKVALPEIINLEDLSARITDDQNQWVTLTSTKGVFDQGSEQLELDGSVDVKSSLGYGLKTEEVEVKMKEGYMQTTTPVEIQSKDILLSAKKLEAIDNGEMFRFTGDVRLRIDAALLSKQPVATDQSSEATSGQEAQ
ncbi:LPS export ABC transporter periplasmic protein LptC [uncultured Cohaesibacter sp.]|uniref:LPS export ABC transporter periplasmic protein LptC n=1 Tax=uncultured Cohaesibacter sp. TaxID=1002546 RepID=UPI0029C77E53|nr:LPS export ABC transporter periplasmic protein LptC [uncultured Cohaesibacter sp.]